MSVNITKPGSPTRAFVFDVALGVSPLSPEAEVDPLSGMLLNLTIVDQILTEFMGLWAAKKWQSLSDLLSQSESFLKARLLTEGVKLQELILQEKRGFFLKTQNEKASNGREEIHEIESKLLKIRYEYVFNEKQEEPRLLKLQSLKDLFSEKIFQTNTDLISLEVEDLTTGEHWSLSAD